MADDRLQQLRRAWDEGDLETHVRLLRERMRAGELSEERVRLAAWFENKAACALIRDLPELTSRWQRLHCAAGLGREASVRVGISVARATQNLRWADSVEAALCALEVWVANPCDEASEVLHASLAEALAGEPRKGYAELVGSLAGLGSSKTYKIDVSDALERLVSAELWWEIQRRGHSPKSQRVPNEARFGVREELALAFYATVRDELVPWALGLRDPLAERVAAREAGRSE